MAAKERTNLLSIVNETRVSIPGPQLLHELISVADENVTAIDFLLPDNGRVELSYAEFCSASKVLTQQILRLLVPTEGSQTIIPVIIPQCPELYLSWRAVLEAGAGFCPIDPETPAERIKFIVKDVSATLVLTLQKTTDRVEALSLGVTHLAVSLESLKLGTAGPQDGFPNNRARRSPLISPHSPAYIMYTSGSTGLPKGVVVSHLSATQSLLAHDEHLPTFRRFLQFASPTFDVSIFEVFFPFFRGVTLVGCERQKMLSDLPGTIRTLNADAAELTPTVAGSLLRTRDSAPCLRVLLTIGEMLTKQVVAEFGGSEDRASMLYAMYGPTEASIHCTIAPTLEASSSISNIGRPLSTVTAYILGETEDQSQLEIAPVGTPGELAVAGQLATCYLNQPAQNSAAFVTLPGYGRIYRTGDRAICRSDRQLEILGRISSGQVKLRGQRIELGEIEEVASKVPGLDLAIASVIDDVLVLFCASSAQVRVHHVQSVCQSWLPFFMRPREIILLGDKIPRLPSGKADRKALENSFRSSELIDTICVEDFHDDHERRIAAVLQSVLPCRVLRDTSFWSCGLDSLKAIRIASKLRPDFSAITPRMIIESETISKLASSLTKQQSEVSQTSQVDSTEDIEKWEEIQKSVLKSLQKMNVKERPASLLPCSPMQVAMLTETMASPDLNFNLVTLNLRAKTSIHELWNAFQILADQCDILRSGFAYTENYTNPFVQVVWPTLERHVLDLLHPFNIFDDTGNDTSTVNVRIHHALYDGWSWDLILDDINAILSNEIPLSRPMFQDLTLHQRLQASLNHEQDVKYWSGLLRGFRASPTPSLSVHRDGRRDRHSVKRLLELSYSRLASLAEALRFSRQSFVMAAWALLLAEYSGCPDISFGVVSSGRHATFQGIEEIIGPCLCTLPVRVDTASVDTFHDVVSYIQRQSIETLTHSHLSLREIQVASGHATATKLFETLLVWQEGEPRADEKRRFVTTSDTHDALEYPLVLEFEPQGGKIAVKITMDPSLISVQHAHILLDQLDGVLTYASTNMNTRVRNLWGSLDKHILSVANTQHLPVKHDFDLISTIRKLATENPSRVALKFVHDFDPQSGHLEVESLSYGNLYARAADVSSKLIDTHNIRPDELVGVVSPKSVNLYVVILAIIMSGAGYMSVDPNTPPERIGQILGEARCVLVITDDNTYSPHEPSMIRMRSLLNNPSSLVEHVIRPNCNDHLAYAIFTSGSTGVPKGVLITRKNLLSNIKCLSKIYPCEPVQDCLLQACSTAFDVSVFEIFWTWHMGMTLCACSNDILFRDIEKLVDRLEITHLSMTPSVAALLHPDKIPKVKVMVTAGEPMNSKVFETWADRGLFQGYGPSETTNICNIRSNVRSIDASNNVGPAFPNTSIFICRRQSTLPGIPNSASLTMSDFDLVPKGAIGEIWVGGEQVGRGYINPELNARSFLEHPKYGRLYRSGDIGRLLADDSLVVLGREDDQIKLRGQRIELGDINTSLIRVKSVKDAASIIVGTTGGKARLVSFWTAWESKREHEMDLQTPQLFERLEQSLPPYMIPDTVVSIDAIPLTRQGKTDKKALMEHYHSITHDRLHRLSRSSDIIEDEIALVDSELEVAKILSDLLAIPIADIKRSSSFYALGLDSIGCVSFRQKLNQAGFAQMDISSILQHPSIGELTPRLVKAQSNGICKGGNTRIPKNFDIDRKGNIKSKLSSAGFEVEQILPCTPLQEYMLAASSSNTKQYRNTLRFGVPGDLEKLKHAWTVVKDRQQLLRTVFVSQECTDMPYAQVVLKNLDLPWIEPGKLYRDLDLADSFICDLYKLQVVQRQRAAPELVLDIHHALYDAEAMSALFDEVQLAYNGVNQQSPVPFQRYLEYMTEMDNAVVDAFWNSHLKDVSTSRLSDILPHSRNAARRINKESLTAAVTLHELEDCAKHQATTMLSVVQGALIRVLSCYLQNDDICIGNVFSGRNLPIDEARRIIAPFFNTLPVRTRLEPHTSNQDLYDVLCRLNIEILPFQPSSLRRIQRQNSPDGKALFDVLLLFQQGNNQLDRHIWQLQEEEGDMSFPYILEVTPDSKLGKIRLILHSEISDQATLRHILTNFDSLLVHTVKYPQARAADFSPISHNLPELLRMDALAGVFRNKASATDDLSADEVQVRDVLTSLSSLKMLRLERNTTIFQLGLDSINTVQIAAQLRKRGYNIRPSEILESPSIAEIAAVCQNRSANNQALGKTLESKIFDFRSFEDKYHVEVATAVSFNPEAIESIRPCTPTQCGILSQYIKSKGTLYYNSLRLQLSHDIDIVRLRSAWQSCMNIHEMLRTGFVEISDETHPFAMVTYRPEATKLPWRAETNHKARQETPSKLSDTNSFTRKLSEPVWDLRLIGSGVYSCLEISILHAVYDAQSIDMILADIVSIYHRQEIGAPSPINPTLSAILPASQSEPAKEYWLNLVDHVQSTKFPDMRIYHADQRTSSVVSEMMAISLSKVLQRCAEIGSSLHVVCQLAWSKLLAAYTGQNKVTFGIILSGRMFDDEMKNSAVFPCINVVPIAVEVTHDDQTLLRDISKHNAGILEHQYAPLSHIKRWLQQEDELFDTVLVLQKFSSGRKDCDTPWTMLEDRASTEYAVSVEILPDNFNNTLQIQITFSEHLLPEEAAFTLLNQLDTTMREILGFNKPGDLSVAHSSLSVITPRDERIDTDICFLHELVERSAHRQPQNHALEFVTAISGNIPTKQSWTYSDLDRQGNRVANLLIQHGVRTGDLVSICFEKCPEASFAILGILKAGCAFVAIDPNAPLARKQFMLEDARCSILLTTKANANLLSSLKEIDTLFVDDSKVLQAMSKDKPILSTPLRKQDVCYCLYTSGTTGTPKGCLISHDGAVQAMLSFQRIFDGHWDSNSRWLQFASFHFDVSVLEQYWSWSVGICVTSAPRDLLLEDLTEFIKATEITHLDLTPSLARLLRPKDVPSLCRGVFIVGGEQVSQDIINTWGDFGCLYNFYGPSEVTIGCTVHPRVSKNAKSTNIGQQWDNVGTFVLKPNTQTPVLRGAIGELCLSGPLVGKGYLNRQDLTQQKFIFLENFATRVYRTGDLVRLLHDDSFEFLGRIDDQVKLRGQRLEIGEINHVLIRSTPEIKASATMVLKHPTHEKEQLVAFYSTSDHSHKKLAVHLVSGDAATVARIRRHCREHLPGYMIPTSFLCVSTVPLSTNNKVEYKQLQALYEKASADELQASSNPEASHNSVDSEVLRDIVNTLENFLHLSSSAVTAGSRLFELGLDSISAIGLSRKLRMKGYINTDVATVMKHSLVADLVHALRQSQNTSRDDGHITAKRKIEDFELRHRCRISQTLEVKESDIENVAPCTALQQGMISKVIGGESMDPVYFAHFKYDISNSVDLQRLRDAWRAVCESTSILRTYFVPTDDGFAQVVLRSGSHVLNHDPLETEESPTSTEQFSDWWGTTKEFSRAIPWRQRISNTKGKTYMSLFIFHGLYDGISLKLLLEKVAKTYNNCLEDSEKVSDFYKCLPHGPLRYHAGAQRFWKSALQSTRNINLPVKFPIEKKTEPITRAPRRTFVLPQLEGRCAVLNITSPSLFHAAWLYILSEEFGVNPTLGLVVSGRAITSQDAENVIGPMFNTIPCAIEELPASSTISDLARACHKFNVDVLPYQNSALREIAKWTDREPRRSLFDSLFVFQKSQMNSFEHDLWRELPSETVPDYPLNLEIEQAGPGHFTGMLVASKEYLDNGEVQSLLDKLYSLMRRIEEGEEIELPQNFKVATERTGPDEQTQVIAENAFSAVQHGISWTASAISVRDELAKLSETDQKSIQLRHPTIFELGLDSIDALKLAARLKSIGLRVPVSRIMQFPTVEGITANIEALTAKPEGAGPEAARKVKGRSWIDEFQVDSLQLLQSHGFETRRMERILPVTPMQEGLLVDFDKYYNVMIFDLEPGVDHCRLQEVWKEVIRSNPIFRTQFVAVENPNSPIGFVQVVRPTASSKNGLVRMLPEKNPEEVIQRFRHEISRAEEAGSVIKIAFAKRPAGLRYMALGMPHAIYDAWSLHLIHHAVAKTYVNGLPSHAENVPAIPIPYESHLEATLKHATDYSGKRFWSLLLNGVQPTLVKESSSRAGNAAPRLIQQQSSLSLHILSEFCKVQGITMQTLGLACWTLTLVQLLGRVDVCFGLVLSGRTTDGSDGLIFPTFNTVIFRQVIGRFDSAKTLLKNVHDRAIQISEHQHFPLREASKVARGMTGSSEVFNTLFTFQKAPPIYDDMPLLYRETQVEGFVPNPPYAINAEMEGRDNHIWWTIAGQENFLSHDDTKRILETLDHVLTQIVENPNEPLIKNSDAGTLICGLLSVGLDWKVLDNNISNSGNIHSIPANENDGKWSETEETIRSVLSQVSKIEPSHIQKDTAFFHLGLDSVSAIKVSALLKKRRLKLPVSEIVRVQTIPKMALAAQKIIAHPDEKVSTTVNEEPVVSVDVLQAHGIDRNHLEQVLPTTAGQRYMLGSWVRSGGRLGYPTIWFEVRGASKARVDQEIEELAKITPMLRTTFIKSSDMLLQVVIKASEISKYKLAFYHESTEINGGLVVALKIHHALYDAVSLQIMISTLKRLCGDSNNAGLVAFFNTDFRPFITNTNNSQMNKLQGQQDFWTSYLSSVTDRSTMVARGSFEAPRVETYQADVVEVSRLSSTLKTHGVSIQALFIAVYARIYHGQRHSRFLSPSLKFKSTTEEEKEEVVLGVYLANRSLDIDSLTRLAAPTFNVVPLKVNVHPHTPTIEAARKIQDDLSAITRAENCGVSLSDIQAWTGTKIDCFVNFLKLPDDDDDDDDDGEEAKDTSDSHHRSSRVRPEEAAVQITHADMSMRREAGLEEELIKLPSPSPFLNDQAVEIFDKVNEEEEGWCIPSIDVEAKVENDQLGVGIFAPSDMLDDGGVRKTLLELRELLMDVC